MQCVCKSIILEKMPTKDNKDDNPVETTQNNIKSIQCVYSIILETVPTKDKADNPVETRQSSTSQYSVCISSFWRKRQPRTTSLWRQHKTTSSQYSTCIPSFWRKRQLRTTTLRRQDKTTSQYSACIPSFWRKCQLRTTRLGTRWRHPGTDDSWRLWPDVPSSAHVEQSLGTDCSSKRPRPFPCSSQSHVSGWKAHCKWVTSILIFRTSVRRNWNRREAKKTSCCRKLLLRICSYYQRF